MSSPRAVLGVVAVGTLLSSLGQSLINVSVPRIATDFGADVASASWVLGAYSLAVSALLLPAGRAGDRFGRRGVYVLGFVVIAGAAVLAALAPTLDALVAARVAQGVGAALLMATGPALTTAAFAASERGRALGMQATATYVGLTMGPALGGAIAQRVGWQPTFWLYVPLAIVGAVLARAVLDPAPPSVAQPFPVTSALLAPPMLAAMLLAITGARVTGLRSAALVVLLALGVAFVRAERASAAPLLPRALLADRAVVTGLTAALAQYAAVYTLLFVLPFYLEERLAMSPDEAGLTMAAQPAAMALTTAASGWLSDRIGTRVPTVLGMFVLAAGLAMIGAVGPDRTWMVVALAIVGLGSGIFTSPNASRVMGAAPPERRGTAAGLLAEARNVGMALGIAISGALFTAFGGSARPDAALVGTVSVAAVLALLGAAASARPSRTP